MTKKEKIYIFDLDHTLLNAKKFREDLGLLLDNDKNIISEKIWEIFEKKDEKLINFIKNKTPEYLFPKVKENLQKISAKKILLTFGNLNFQKEKVTALKLSNIFDEIIITDKNKINFLWEFYQSNQDKEIIFINDTYNKRFNENQEISKKIPEIKIMEVDNYLPEKKKTIQEIFKKIVYNL